VVYTLAPIDDPFVGFSGDLRGWFGLCLATVQMFRWSPSDSDVRRRLGRLKGAVEPRPASWRELKDERGAMTSEYVVLVGACGLIISVALAALGPQVVTSYQGSRRTLIAPIP
jgi:Flp pilus assembly pilin Flp